MYKCPGAEVRSLCSRISKGRGGCVTRAMWMRQKVVRCEVRSVMRGQSMWALCIVMGSLVFTWSEVGKEVLNKEDEINWLNF